MKNVLRVSVITKKGNSFEVMLPAKRVICFRCDGTGIHDHPAFSNGVEGLDDPDFAESYFAGSYDVRCEECNGEKIVLEVDREAISAKMLSRLERAEKEQWETEREIAAERRWGC